MALPHHVIRSAHERERFRRVSVIVLLVSIVALALILVGVARSGTSALFLIPPAAIATWAIVSLRLK